MIKPEAKIYDATAGNRSIYETKDHPFILYGDIEPDLFYKPDIMVDCTKTNFPDKSKNLIIFDPPHECGRIKNEGIFSTPSLEVANKKWPKYYRETPPRYYGGDKYKNKDELRRFVYETQKEFYRILSDGGALLMKWSENRIDLKEIIKLFRGWSVILKIRCFKQGNTATPTYWVMLMKAPMPSPQTELGELAVDVEQP